jgi:hypothetical protein
MNDMICRKSMTRCITPGMCSPHGGCKDPVTDSLREVVEQQQALIASLRAELRESYGIDAAVQEEHMDLEAAAKTLAACMDYPWEHMPEQGRASMREHARTIVSAALSASAEPSAPVVRDERAEFESWVSTRKICTHKGATLKKDSAGGYMEYRINDRWLTWQARAALEARP